MAYPTRMTAALSGATVSQLRHWRHARTGPLLSPEVATSPRVLYSFRDILALRMFVRLRKNASLQRIRAAVQNLRQLGDREHLASYTLVADEAGRIRLLTAGEAVDLVEYPGQLLLPLEAALEPFMARAGVLVPDLFRPRPNLAVDPETQGGIPVIAGTRVPYDAVASLMRDGVTPEQIDSYYPGVTADAAKDALDFARYVDSYDPSSQVA